MFPIVAVPDNAPRSQEELGSKPKFWYDDPNLGPCLFKETRPATGEDWTEVIAAYLCESLEIPHAEYHLAEWQGKRGVITRAVQDASERLFLGNELLAKIVPDYGAATLPRGGNRQHTLDNVLRCLAPYAPPTGATIPTLNPTADEVFIGYLMLDALIGNTDRHHENWGCIAASNGADLRLAPTYDHASSLGRELTEKRRLEMLTTKDTKRTVEAYCTARKSRSALYRTLDDKEPMPMIEAYQFGAERYPAAAHAWLGQLSSLSERAILDGFANTPEERISELGVECGVAILLYNRRRLLNG